MFSSNSDEWETPQKLFDKLNQEFNFILDVCANQNNTKCKNHITLEIDGLKQDWSFLINRLGGNSAWMNPPYSQIKDWIKKAYEESQKGITVVCLIPSRTDTKYFQEYCFRASEIRFIKGRLKFGNGKNSAPFPSAIIIFKPGKHELKVTPYII